MTISNKTTIKAFFETGDFPTQSNFSDFIDSCIFTAETTAQAVNADLSVGGAFSVSGKSTLASIAATTVSATSVFGSFTGNLKATIVSATTVSPNNITGTNTNDNAAAGSVGEIITSLVSSGGALSLSTGVSKNVTFIPLQAGDYDVDGNIGFSANAATTANQYVAAINTISATLPADTGNGAYNITSGTFGAGLTAQLMPTGTTRVSLAASANAYLVSQSTFSVNTMSAYGFIRARRVR